MKKLLSISIILFLISACSSDDAKITESTTEKKIMLSSAGVGPINASTPFNMHQMTLAFEDYSVTEYTQFQKGESVPIIRISDNSSPIMIINPDTERKNIFSIMVKSKQIGNALGHEIGSAYKEIYSYETIEPCIIGAEEFTGKVLCIAPKTPNILYLFNGEWDGPKEQVPPSAILSSWVLEAIIWKPEN